MAQRPFKMVKNEQYIECHRPFKLPNGKYSGMIRVYELLNPAKQSMLTTMDWSYETVIVDPKAATGYNSLEIDGHLVNLEKLAQDLCKSRLRVNKSGYCYFQINNGVADTAETFGFTFYRMNDMWNWTEYGLKKMDGPTNNNDHLIIWDRFDILRKGDVPLVSFHQAIDTNLNAQLKEKDTEIEALKEQLKRLQDKTENTHVTKNAVPSSLFQFLVHPISGWPTMETFWKESFQKQEFGSFTPDNNRVVMGNHNYGTIIFYIDVGKKFDTDNWVFMGVKEREAPILVYEGSAHSVNIGGHQVFAPCDPKLPLVQYPKIVIFGVAILANYGARLAIR